MEKCEQIYVLVRQMLPWRESRVQIQTTSFSLSFSCLKHYLISLSVEGSLSLRMIRKSFVL